MNPVQSAVEAFLVIFMNLPQPVYSFIAFVLVLFIIAGIIRIVFKL